MNFLSSPELTISHDLPAGTVTWRSPSNIAIVKYWGKYGHQIPRNPSLSFTLSESYSETTLQYSERKDHSGAVSTSFAFEGQAKPAFQNRVESFLTDLISAFPFIEQLHFDIRSRNSFPHSSGIASSASAFSALALCLCSLEDKLFDTLSNDELFRQKASFIARLGSGSACRSIFEKAALWGKTGLVEGASDEFAVPIGDRLHQNFSDYRDTILLVSREPKSVSSSAGHQLMENHPFAPTRYEEAKRHLSAVLECLSNGDLDQFIHICELEAMQLHALMMSSNPYYLLIEPNSIRIIQSIRRFRKESGIPVSFTLDAGPNVHLLFPDSHREDVDAFISSELVNFCHQGSLIHDHIGDGPLQID